MFIFMQNTYKHKSKKAAGAISAPQTLRKGALMNIVIIPSINPLFTKT